jgi:alpha-amylase/alpha-mannosidase (GH57 family)
VTKYLCIHGHFYQPPRENPWLEVVEAQDSAAPFHDWNARITAECYAPNAAARILGPKGHISKIINNYEYISFNFGPTLLSWLAAQAPEVHQALVAADQRSAARLGQGNAVAQVYNHTIMPLASRRDKLTQIRWGIQDFRHRFRREPRGMWLAETAADMETLACLAEENIAFTILSPHQAARVRPPDGAWQEVSGGRVETRRPYWVRLPGGRRLAVFFYHGPASQAVAFEHLLDDGARLAARLGALHEGAAGEPLLASVATDGESYGHHHRFGEMALAFALDRLQADPEVRLTNYAAFLEAHPPAWEAEILAPSAWSCPHGVDRWRADCGCALDPGRGWSQAWREPLRRALDRLNARLATLAEQVGGELFQDPWAARDDYLQVLLHDTPEAWEELLARHQRRPLSAGDRVRAAKLLESQRWGQCSLTSCGWFFDDLAGIEAVQNLRFAARALQLAEDLDGGGWEQDLVRTLAEARSNQPAEGDGAQVWQRRVAPARVGPCRVAAHAAIAGVMGDAPPPAELYCYRLATVSHRHRHNLGLDLAWGRVEIAHRRLGETHPVAFAALHAGGHDFTAFVARAGEGPDLEGLGREAEEPLRLLEREALLRLLERRVGGRRFGLREVFLEGRRGLAREMLGATMDRYRETARSLYEANREVMNFLHDINVPLPRVFTALAEAMLTDDLIMALAAGPGGPLPPSAGQLARQARSLGLRLEAPALRRRLEDRLTADLAALGADPADAGRLEHANQLLDLAAALEITPDLWRPQNLFHRLWQQRGEAGLPAGLAELGRRLGFAL